MLDNDMERAAISWLTVKGYTITRSDEEPKEVFDEFWSLYPRKVGKAAARKAFGKADPYKALNGLKDWLAASAFNTNPEYVLHGSTWLNQKCYNDIPVPFLSDFKKPTQGPSRTRKALDDWLNDEGWGG